MYQYTPPDDDTHLYLVGIEEDDFVWLIQQEELSAVGKAKLCKELRDRYPDRYPNWDGLAARIGVKPETVRAWVRTLALPEAIQALIAPRERQRRVPDGRIDYQTALRVREKIHDPERQVKVAMCLVEKRVSHRAANEIIRRAAAGEPVNQINTSEEQVAQQQGPNHQSALSLGFSHRNSRAILDGSKSQTTRRRLDPRIAAGSVVVASVIHFADLEIEEVRRVRLRDLTEEDARQEGASSLAEFMNQWKRQYGYWDPKEVVNLVRFRVLRVL